MFEKPTNFSAQIRAFSSLIYFLNERPYGVLLPIFADGQQDPIFILEYYSIETWMFLKKIRAYIKCFGLMIFLSTVKILTFLLVTTFWVCSVSIRNY